MSVTIRSRALSTLNGFGKARPRRRTASTLPFLWPVLAFSVRFFVYPLAKNVQVSLQDFTLASLYTGDAPYIGLSNYGRIFDDPVFRTAVGNTIVFTLFSIVFQLTIGLALAVFFVRNFPLNALLRSLLLVAWLLPLVVSGTVFRWMVDTNNGIINHILLGLHVVNAPVPWLTDYDVAMVGVLLCNIWIGVPFNMLILYGGLQSIPPDFYEAAAMDGAGRLRQFWFITLPMLRPVLLIVTTLGLIYRIKIFDGTLDGYRDAISLGGEHLATSLVVAGGTTLLTLLIAAPGAYAIAVLRARGAQAVILFLLVAQLIPGIVMANALYRIFRPLGLLNSVQGLILADSTLAVPFAVLILRAFMASIPRELMEASTIDGADHHDAVISLTRSAWAGSQRYGAALWSGDIPTTFESLAAQIRAGLNVAVSGIPWWTTDIGGFHGGRRVVRGVPRADDPLVAVRDVLPAAAHARPPRADHGDGAGHSGGPNELWSYGDEAYAVMRSYLGLRARLTPYLLEQMDHATATGIPPMRPLFLEFPADPTAW